MSARRALALVRRASARGAARVRETAALLAAVACGRGSPAGDGGATESVPPSVRYDQHVAAGGVEPPAGQFINAFRGDKRAAAEGEQLFVSMNCDQCHGTGATGVLGPSLITGRWRYGGDDAAVFQSIFYGRPQGMPAFGGIMTAAAVSKVVSYLKSMSPPKAVPTQGW